MIGKSTYTCTLQNCLGGSASLVAGVGLACEIERKRWSAPLFKNHDASTERNCVLFGS